MVSYTSFLSCLRCRGHLANALQCCPAHRHMCHCTHPESGLLYVLRGMSLKREELCPTIQCTRCNTSCKLYKAHRLPCVYHHVCSSLHTCKLTDCSIRNYVVLKNLQIPQYHNCAQKDLKCEGQPTIRSNTKGKEGGCQKKPILFSEGMQHGLYRDMANQPGC